MAGVLKKAHVKKLLAQVEDSIANFEPSLQDKLSQQKIILREKLDTLKTLDSEILELADNERKTNPSNMKLLRQAKSRMKSRGLWFASIRL